MAKVSMTFHDYRDMPSYDEISWPRAQCLMLEIPHSKRCGVEDQDCAIGPDLAM